MKIWPVLLMGPTLGLFVVAILFWRTHRYGLALLCLCGAMGMLFGLPALLHAELSWIAHTHLARATLPLPFG